MSQYPLVLFSNSLGTTGKTKTQREKSVAKWKPEANAQISSRLPTCLDDKERLNYLCGVMKEVQGGYRLYSTGLQMHRSSGSTIH